MDILGIIFYLFLFSLLITAVSAIFFKSRGPWGSYWSSFLIIFLFVWIASIWMEPIGPIYYGLAWGPIIFIGFLITILLLSATPAHYRGRRSQIIKNIKQQPEPTGTEKALNIFFWITISILIIGIVAKYWS